MFALSANKGFPIHPNDSSSLVMDKPPSIEPSVHSKGNEPAGKVIQLAGTHLFVLDLDYLSV